MITSTSLQRITISGSDPGETDPAHVAVLLKPFDSRKMRVYPVSSAVGNVNNDGPECAEEKIVDVEERLEQRILF